MCKPLAAPPCRLPVATTHSLTLPCRALCSAPCHILRLPQPPNPTHVGDLDGVAYLQKYTTLEHLQAGQVSKLPSDIIYRRLVEVSVCVEGGREGEAVRLLGCDQAVGLSYVVMCMLPFSMLNVLPQTVCLI